MAFNMDDHVTVCRGVDSPAKHWWQQNKSIS